MAVCGKELCGRSDDWPYSQGEFVDECLAQVTKAPERLACGSAFGFPPLYPHDAFVSRVESRAAAGRSAQGPATPKNIYPDPGPPWMLLAEKEALDPGAQHWYLHHEDYGLLHTLFSVFHTWINRTDRFWLTALN